MRWIGWLVVFWGLASWAAPPSVQKQAVDLQTILQQADDAYFNQGDPVMGDAAYDALRETYEQLLKKYPELKASSKVGAKAPADTPKLKHSAPVLSLDKAYSNDEVAAFVEKCGTDQRYCVEPKIDGLSLVLRYRDGRLVAAITRGDGEIGVDATLAVFATGAVALQLKTPVNMEVRGELFLPDDAFARLNRRRVDAGKRPLKSARSTAAGTLRMKNYADIARRGLQFRAFALRDAEPMPPTHTDALTVMKDAGLEVVESRMVGAADVIPVIAELNQRRDEFFYETDGLVIRLNDTSQFEAMGTTAHHPRGAIARKYRADPAGTRLLSIEWSRSDADRLTPVAIFEPVEMEGAVVQRASLYNAAHLKAMDLRIGDWIHVIRAGGAVPEIVGVDKTRRTGDEKLIQIPPEE